MSLRDELEAWTAANRRAREAYERERCHGCGAPMSVSPGHRVECDAYKTTLRAVS